MDFIQDYSSDDKDDDNDEGDDADDDDQMLTLEEQGGHQQQRRGNAKMILWKDAEPFERSVRHIRGNWAGHIYACCQESEWMIELAETSIERFRVALELSGWSGDVVRHDGLHISLSRPFFLQLASIESFQRELSNQLRHERAMIVQIQEDVILENDEGTRTFFGWKLVCHDSLRRVVGLIDSVMQMYRQPLYYSPAIFHISLASVRGRAPVKDTMRYLQADTNLTSSAMIPIRTLSCTIGSIKRSDYVLRP